MFKRILISVNLLAFLFISLFAPNIVSAQEDTWYHQNFDTWYDKVYGPDIPPDEIFGERYTAAQVEWVLYGVAAFIIHAMGDDGLIGCIFKALSGDVDIGQCTETINEIAGKISYSNNSPFLAFGNLAPMSGISYLKERVQKLNPTTDIQAQGFGYRALEPVEQVWEVVRNVSYFILIFIIIIMAFMIMFRMKIAPQVVITIQSALPKIVIALILITFSYAIAGFLIDLMYLVIGILAMIISGSGLTNASWRRTFEDLTYMQGAFQLMILYFISFLVAVVAIYVSETGLIGVIAAAILGLGTGGAVPIILLILLVILAIALLIMAFKIWFMLLKAFVNIILLTIVGPVAILGGTLGLGGGLGSWIKSMASHLAVFPVTGGMFFIAFLFLFSSIPEDTHPILKLIIDLIIKPLAPFGVQEGAFNPATTWKPPLTWTGPTAFLWLVVSLVTLTLIPKVADIVKSLVAGKPFGYGSAIAEGFGTMAGVGLAVGRYTSKKQDEVYSAMGSPSRRDRIINKVYNVYRIFDPKARNQKGP